MNQWAPELASAEVSLNRKPMTTLRGNAPRDVADAIKSKVIEFQRLEQQARNIATNRVEGKEVNRALERDGAFRAHTEAEVGHNGLNAKRNRPGEARLGSKVRGEGGKGGGHGWQDQIWPGRGCCDW